MLSRIATALSVILLSGCASLSPSVPADYSGPRARLEDSSIVHSNSKADMFVAEQIDGNDIDNSMRRSQQASQGRGFELTTLPWGRSIVAGRPIKVAVKGRTVFAAPIQALTGTVYQVKGVVELTAKPDTTYIVRGEFTDQYSAVWLEDASSKAVVGKKVEVNGSAKLGILEK